MSAVVPGSALAFELDPVGLAEIAKRQAKQAEIIAEERAKARKPTRRQLHAGMSVQDIVLAFGRVNWGPFQGRTWAYRRMLLEVLSLMMREQRSDRDACLITTASQLAERMACHQRTIRRCLHDLEDLQMIEWRRGGVWDGKPQPGVIRIIKKTLVEWVLAWRPRHDEAQQAKRLETIARLKTLRNTRTPPKERDASAHADSKSSLSVYQQRAGNATALSGKTKFRNPRPAETLKKIRSIADKHVKTTKKTKEEPMNQTLNKNKTATLPPPEFMPLVCGHRAVDPRSCNHCRYEAWTAKQVHDRYEEEQAKRKRAEARKTQRRAFEEALARYEKYRLTHYGHLSRVEQMHMLRKDPTFKALSEACNELEN